MYPLPCESGKCVRFSRFVNSHKGEVLTMHYISIKRGRLVGENRSIVDTELMAEVKPSLHSVSGLCHALKHDDFGDGIFFAKPSR